MNSDLSPLQQHIINGYQKNFPLCDEPFKKIAQALNSQESEVIQAMEALSHKNILSRLGPVFDHKKAGASTLAAIAVPEQQLDDIAGIVNQFDQVNHNYAREHRYNLWFVVTAKDPIELNKTLTDIEHLTGFKVLVLPMEASYHIDLSFRINFDSDSDNITKGIKTEGNITEGIRAEENNDHGLIDTSLNNTAIDHAVLSASLSKKDNLVMNKQAALRTMLEKGLPLVKKPYLHIAEQLNLNERQVIDQIALWLHEGLIKRFGLVVKHRQLGYVANAMVVWNIADENVDDIAGDLSKRDEISLCYRRPRRLPDWPYNLFCMIHGKSRAAVEKQIQALTLELNLSAVEKDVLFSYKAYKQNGARYSTSKIANHSSAKHSSTNHSNNKLQKENR